MQEQGNKDRQPTARAAEGSRFEAGRRDFIKTSAVLAGGLAGAAAGLAGQTTEAVAEVTANGQQYKVIDFRCRPPLQPYSGLYNLRLNFLAKRPNTLANPATGSEMPPSTTMVGQPGAMEQWWKDLDAAGVDVAVSNGRYAAGDPNFSMDSPQLADLQNQYPGRFIGLAAINLDQPMVDTVSDIENAITNLGLRGANFEPGYRTKNGGAATVDNADFYPIYETMIALDMPLMIQTGAFAGIENFGAANEIARFDTVMTKFPGLKIVLAHGGYPSITETLALALKHPSVFVCPDVYTFWPGGQLYQQNIELLPDQFIYGSAFPFGNPGTTLEMTLNLPLSEATMKKYLHANAAQLLKL